MSVITLTPQDVRDRLGTLGLRIEFTPDELAIHAPSIVVTPGARVCQFQTPQDNSSLNLLYLRSLVGTRQTVQLSFFEHPWYLEEDFARSSLCSPGWHSLHMDPLPESIGQPKYYSDHLDARGFCLPGVLEVVLMLFLHFIGTGEQLLRTKHTWCAEFDAAGRSVTAGAFGRNGLFISAHPPLYASRGLGICAKIRP